MVTSSAVVGSSARRRAGSQASAMAIMTRWRMPPLNWCGWSWKRAAAEGILTSSRTARAWALASRGGRLRWRRRASATWAPMVMTGLRLVMGSWEDHGHAVAAEAFELGFGEADEVGAVEGYFSGGSAGVGGQAHDGEGGHGFAATAFADEGQGFAAVEDEGNAVDGGVPGGADAKFGCAGWRCLGRAWVCQPGGRGSLLQAWGAGNRGELRHVAGGG